MIVLDHPDPAATAQIQKPALARFITRAKKAAALQGELSILLADDKQLKQLNKQFRGKNKPTDVLSFPAPEEMPELAGDLAISIDTAAKQAAEHAHSLDEELRILLLHGILHLAGYDHEADNGEMAAKESELRTKLGLSTNLIHRAHNAPKKKAIKKSLVPSEANRSASSSTNQLKSTHISALRPSEGVRHAHSIKRQRRDAIPAWGNAPGSSKSSTKGLKARSIKKPILHKRNRGETV